MSTAGLLMMLASSGKKTLVTKTFPADGSSWTAPAGVTRVESLIGKGGDGAPVSQAVTETFAAYVVYHASGGGGTAGNFTWNSAQGIAVNARNAVNAGGNLSYSQASIDQYPSDYAAVITSTPLTGVVPGSASLVEYGAWATNGPISSTGYSTVRYNYYVPSTNGSAATAFGQTFPGGVAGPAGVQNFGAQTVTPGQTYSISIPDGSSYVTITYYIQG